MNVNHIRRAARPPKHPVDTRRQLRHMLRVERLEDRTTPSSSPLGLADWDGGFGDLLAGDFADRPADAHGARGRWDDLADQLVRQRPAAGPGPADAEGPAPNVHSAPAAGTQSGISDVRAVAGRGPATPGPAFEVQRLLMSPTAAVTGTPRKTAPAAMTTSVLAEQSTTISGRVWFDHNNNGLQDNTPDEFGLEGVTIRLWDGPKTAVLATTEPTSTGTISSKSPLPSRGAGSNKTARPTTSRWSVTGRCLPSATWAGMT